MDAIWPWSHLVNPAALDRGAHALVRVATAANRSDHVLVHSATATFSANGPFCGKEAIEYLATHVSRDLVPCRDLFEKKTANVLFVREMCAREILSMSSAAPQVQICTRCNARYEAPSCGCVRVHGPLSIACRHSREAASIPGCTGKSRCPGGRIETCDHLPVRVQGRASART